MFAKVYGGTIYGIEGIPVCVEADTGRGLPVFEMVGYLGSEVKEAKERVRTAIRNSGFELPAVRITVNLSPADLRKQGNFFDLPIAVAILTACGFLPDSSRDYLYIGELGLDGSLRPVAGALALASCGIENGIDKVFMPCENAAEGACYEKARVIAVGSLSEVVALLKEPGRILFQRPPVIPETTVKKLDFSDIKGQHSVKRAMEIAAAGMHNILLIGPPGTGKSMTARRIPSILPSMTIEEQLEISKIYSISGLLQNGNGLIQERPFRSPHHTISGQALIGGGLIPKPGEISLANGGVLFLDELTEYPKPLLEMLRQPLEDREVVISRLHATVRYPTRFMLAAAMNPCHCGYFPDRRMCKCTRGDVERYLNKLSQPFLDRIDLCVEAPPISFQEMTGNEKEESSQEIRKRVEKAVGIQKERYREEHLYFNSQLYGKLLSRYCFLEEKEEKLMEAAFQKMKLSARAYDRILKVARTIADLDESERIQTRHISEAITYRAFERKYWGL